MIFPFFFVLGFSMSDNICVGGRQSWNFLQAVPVPVLEISMLFQKGPES